MLFNKDVIIIIIIIIIIITPKWLETYKQWGNKWGNFREQNNPHPSPSPPFKIGMFVVFCWYSVVETVTKHCLEWGGIGKALFLPLS